MIPFFRNTKILLIATIVSIGLLILWVCLCLLLFPGIIEDQVDKNVKLEEGKEQWDRFKKLPFDIIFKVYFFNITNPDDVLRGEKPIVQEIGPYIYGEAREKNISQINSDTVIYEQNEIFTFNQEASGNLKDTDTITTINSPLMALIQELEDISLIQGSINKCINRIFQNDSSIFITKSVDELLFSGSKMCDTTVVDPNCSSLVFNTACTISSNKRNIEKHEGENNSTYLKFSYFDYKNNKSDGLYEVRRGIEDVYKLGEIIKLNNNDSLNIWKGADASCDVVRGTDSTIYPPRIGKGDTLTILNTDICRKVEIFYTGTETYKGIEGYMFVPSTEMLYSRKAEDDCYCTKTVKNVQGNPDCYLDGVSDMYACVGAPIILSFPHFLWADEKYTRDFSLAQINPVDEKHRIFLLVEPNTGTPLRGGKRVQLNTPLRPIKQIPITDQLPRVVLPIFWVDEGIELPDEYVDKLNDLYFSKVKLVDGLKYGFIALFSLTTLIFGVLYIKVMFFTKKI